MDLLRLEQQRQALDANLHQLRQSLKHWQTWEAEYEGLKEELLQHEGALSTSDTFAAISDSYGGDLVNASEIRDLTGLSTGTPRSVKQIVELIQRRQEYVQRNIDTVQRQFFDAEAKQEELAFATSTHGAIDDENEAAAEEPRNLPLTEIHEELDEDGNIISTRLSRPEEDTANVVDSLRKAGLSQDDLKDIRPTTETVPRVEELKPAITNATPVLSVNPTNKISPDKRATSDSAVASTTTTTTANTSSSDRDEPERPSIRKKSVSFTADTKEPTEQIRPESEEGRKSVSFAEKVAVMPAAPPPDMRSVSFSPKVEEIPPAAADGVAVASPEITATSTASSRDTDQMETETQSETTKTIPIQADPARQKELREAYKPGEKVIQLNDDDEIESVQVVLPENESAEDAATRREMLEYHLNEVGHVVAQMDLDDSAFGKYGDEEEEDGYGDDAESYHTTSEYLDDGDTPYTSGLSDYDDDDEDEEDEHGRSTRRGISPEYRKQMLELQDRLIGNMGPDPKDEEIRDVDADLDPADVHRLVIRSKRASVSSNASEESSEKKPSSSSLTSAASSTTSSSKKRVSFAESVDIAEPSAASSGMNATVTAAPPLKAQKHQEGENVAPVSEKVAERSTATSHSVAAPSSATASGRKSKFMQSRAVPAASHDIAADTSSQIPSSQQAEAAAMDYDYDNPTGPPGRTLADTLTERVRSQKAVEAPSADNDNDNNDEIVDRRQLASEYYRRRNNLIQEQGGFGPTTDEDEMLGGALMEEREDGKVRRVSRFKAARIKPM